MRCRANPLQAIVTLSLAVIACSAIFFGAHRLFYRCAYPVHYSAVVEKYGGEKSIPPSLIYAVIRTESGFNPSAESSIGARGLMQITEDTLDWTAYRLGEDEQDFDALFDGEANIKYGAALLRLLLDEFGTVENALCAYHAGWGNAKKWLADPDHAPDGRNIVDIPFGDTSRYVKKVMETQEIYRSLYELL